LHNTFFHQPFLTGVAQAAVSPAFAPELFESLGSNNANEEVDSQSPRMPLPLLEILRQAYDSSTLKPVMPYNKNANLRERLKDAFKDGRPEEILRLANLWWPGPHSSIDFNKKVEELFGRQRFC
jgi:hypothetical protein